jgi:hypothetical protein
MSSSPPRIREVYREYELGWIPFEGVIAASERIIAASATTPNLDSNTKTTH